jgi:serine protease Do
MEDNQTQKNHSFVREKIKEKPFNKKRELIRLLLSALSGILFAGMACLVFALMLPRLQMALNTPAAVETETMSGESETDSSETGEQAGDGAPNGTGAAAGDEDLEESGEGGGTSGETGEENVDGEAAQGVVTTEPSDLESGDGAQSASGEEGSLDGSEAYSLSIADYQQLQDELYSIGEQVNASVVTITSVVSDTDLFHNAYDAEDQGSGVIISENDEEYLILTERKVIKDASRISVTFLDDTVCDAALKKEDRNTGIAVLSVAKNDAGAAKTVAAIGSSNAVRGGMIVIALGSPLGTNYSILTGNITSTNNEVSVEDHNYTVFTTDIVANQDGSGILINVDGEIVGIVMQEYSTSSAENTLTAISAGELAPVIEKLCAGDDIPYLGIKVSTVTSKIESDYGIPKGVYIREVTMDSPAMNAGLQSGDVITKLGGEEVRTDLAFSNALLSLSAGDEVTVEVKRKGAEDYTTIKYDVTLGAPGN